MIVKRQTKNQINIKSILKLRTKGIYMQYLPFICQVDKC